jgi:hypothetical protein
MWQMPWVYIGSKTHKIKPNVLLKGAYQDAVSVSLTHLGDPRNHLPVVLFPSIP